MNRRIALSISISSLATAACSAMGQMGRPSYGVVVVGDTLRGSSVKYGVSASTDEGRNLFAFSRTGNFADNSSYSGTGLPKWVRVTWREGDFIQRYDPINKSAWTGGKIIGDHTIEVASRIPQDVQIYASQGKGRAIRLRFRLHDEGVLLAWDVQEVPPQGGGGWFYSMQGGDFKSPVVRDGKVVEKGWYIDAKTGQKIETDF